MQTDVIITELQKYGYVSSASDDTVANHDIETFSIQSRGHHLVHAQDPHRPQEQEDEGNVSIVMEEPSQTNPQLARSPSPPALESLGLSSMALQLIKYEAADSGRERWACYYQPL